MKFLLVLRIFCIILIAGCENKSGSLNNPFVFEIISSNNTSDFSVQEAILKADSSGQLQLHIELRSQSENEIPFSSFDFKLETASGLRSSPVDDQDSIILVKPKSRYSHDFIFEPINSLKLYHLTGLKGDLGNHYKLNIKNDLVTVEFKLPDSRHKLFQDKWGGEKEVIVFQPDTRSDFDKVEAEYLLKNIKLGSHSERIEHDAHASEQEILVDGLNTSFSSYAIGDTLTIKIRLTNHSPFATGLTPSLMRIQIDSLDIMPTIESRMDYQEIPRSQRAIAQLKYLLPVLKTTEFTLDVSSVTFLTPKPVPVLHESRLAFRRVSM